MEQLEGRVAVVTGAGSGIGLAIAEALADRGMQVMMTDIDEGPVADAAARIRDGGGAVEHLALDVRDPDAVEGAAAHAVERHGGLHVGVNNAGVVNGGLTWEVPLDEWRRVFDVNLWGVIHGVRAFVPRILATGEEGHVVNVASMAAVIAPGNLGPYTVAKHGVLGLSDVLRTDLDGLGAPVGVSVVMPGSIRTGMNPIGTVEPATVAANVVDAIERRRPYVFTDRQATRMVEDRLRAIIDARADVLPPETATDDRHPSGG